MKFHFKYCLGLPEETVSSSLVFGGACIGRSSSISGNCSAATRRPASDALLGEFWEGWQERDLEQVRFGKGEDRESLGQLAERILTAFQQSEVARPSGQILAVEEELRGPRGPRLP